MYYNNASPDNFEDLTSKAKSFLETQDQLLEFRRDNGLKEKEIQFLREENIKMMQLISQYEQKVDELTFHTVKEKSSTSILISELEKTVKAEQDAVNSVDRSWSTYTCEQKYGPVTMIKEVAEDSIDNQSDPEDADSVI